MTDAVDRTTGGKKKKIGIYGGSFSPPHNGHVHAARAFIRGAELDALYIMPALLPPHKTLSSGDTPEDRLAMARLAFSELPGTEVSDFEIKSGGKSYTVNTLEHFAPEGELTFLCGTDMFLTMDKWYRSARIFELARIALVRRDSYDARLENEIKSTADRFVREYGARVILIDAPAVELSSTSVREAAARGEDISALVPQPVAEYIRSAGLYGAK